MRLLVVNSNTSAIVTEKVTAEARTAAAPGTEIVAVTGTFGARVIGSRAEHAIGEHSTIALVARHAVGCDAVVIAVSYDTGLRAARELLPIPVVGMTEAGLLTACMLGGRIGVVTFGRRVLPLYHELVTSYGLARAHRRLAGAGEHRGVCTRCARRARSRDRRGRRRPGRARPRRDRRPERRRDGRRAAHACRSDVPVPLIDCIACGVRQAELLASLALPKPTTGSYASPANRELVDVEPAIAQCFAAATARS